MSNVRETTPAWDPNGSWVITFDTCFAYYRKTDIANALNHQAGDLLYTGTNLPNPNGSLNHLTTMEDFVMDYVIPYKETSRKGSKT